MSKTICLIGLDEPETDYLRTKLNHRLIIHPTLPGFHVQEGRLFVDKASGGWRTEVDKVVFHGIFEEDFEFLVGLCLWGGPCFPNSSGMLDCRNKHACLVRALACTDFPGTSRGFLPRGNRLTTEPQTVAKWGNWHCGENKERFSGTWQAEYSSTLEPFIEGEAVRVAIIGEHEFQIRLEGDDWKKSIHPQSASFMPVDSELLTDTRKLADHFQLEMIANDYMISKDGQKVLLEVNHIPNVTRFAEMRKRYLEHVFKWIEQDERL